MPQKQSKFIYLYEHETGERQYDYNSLVDGVKPFDTDAGARTAALANIKEHSDSVYNDFQADEWFIHIVEIQSATTYRLRNAGIALTDPKKLI